MSVSTDISGDHVSDEGIDDDGYGGTHGMGIAHTASTSSGGDYHGDGSGSGWDYDRGRSGVDFSERGSGFGAINGGLDDEDGGGS